MVVGEVKSRVVIAADDPRLSYLLLEPVYLWRILVVGEGWQPVLDLLPSRLLLLPVAVLRIILRCYKSL